MLLTIAAHVTTLALDLSEFAGGLHVLETAFWCSIACLFVVVCMGCVGTAFGLNGGLCGGLCWVFTVTGFGVWGNDHVSKLVGGVASIRENWLCVLLSNVSSLSKK